MKKLILVAVLSVTLCLVGLTNLALAADLAHGGQLFTANCAACHAGGKNLVNADKSLKKEALDKYGMYDLEAIKTQITKGKGAMPGFGTRLSAEDIEDVANYVLAQADKGW